MLIIGTLLSGTGAFAQQRKIDSLVQLLKLDKEDTLKAIHMIKLCWAYKNISKYDSALYFGEKGKSLSEKLNYRKGVANALRNIGGTYYQQTNYSEALACYFNSLKESEAINDKNGMAISYNNIGGVYENQKDHKHSLENLEKSLKLSTEIGDHQMESSAYVNLGNNYMDLKDSEITDENFGPGYRYFKAYEYYSKARGISIQWNDKQILAYTYHNIGSLFIDLTEIEASIRNNILSHSWKVGNSEPSEFQKILLDSAMEFMNRSLRINMELMDRYNTIYSYKGIGKVFKVKNEYNSAIIYYLKAISIADSLEAFLETEDAAKELSGCYELIGNHKLSLEWYKRYISARDSVESEKNTKAGVELEMKYQFAKKQAADSIKNSEHAKQEELKHDQEIRQQRIYTYGGGAGFLLMLTVAIISFRAFRNKQKANEIISIQKSLVEEKQKEILDSIHYAKRIQQSLLPTEKFFTKYLDNAKK